MGGNRRAAQASARGTGRTAYTKDVRPTWATTLRVLESFLVFRKQPTLHATDRVAKRCRGHTAPPVRPSPCHRRTQRDAVHFWLMRSIHMWRRFDQLISSAAANPGALIQGATVVALVRVAVLFAVWSAIWPSLPGTIRVYSMLTLEIYILLEMAYLLALRRQAFRVRELLRDIVDHRERLIGTTNSSTKAINETPPHQWSS